jgi:mRNA-degrading endonuclease toxin of MazEF toxin-antitoxin module
VPRAKRGEIWIADLGLAAKVRPVLVLSVAYEGQERAIVSYVIRTTSLRGISTKCVTKLVACRTEHSTRKVWVRYRRSNSKGE